MAELIYPELSYKLLGLAFKVFNVIGYGMSEKVYQRAYAELLSQENVSFLKERKLPIKFNDKIIGNYYADFVIENKLVLELKVVPKFGYTHIKQVMNYLKSNNYQLAILIYFTRDGVKYRRILNA